LQKSKNKRSFQLNTSRFGIIGQMARQGKFTKRVTPGQQAKRQARRRFRWLRNLSWKKRFLYFGTPILAFLVLTPIFTYLYFARDISDQERLMNRNNTGVVLYANDGKTEIYSLGKAKHRDLLQLDQISDTTEKALISSEDKNFYEHGGFSLFSIIGALYANVVTGGNNYGGSTLTQQLAKNTLLSENKNFLRKFQELSISIAIESKYSKDEILAMYLNSAFFGGNSFGIEDAARTYYNKSPADLTLGESAMLIGLLPAPNAYSPLYGNMEFAKERQNTVLSRMVDNKVITEEQKTAAAAEELPLQPVKALADSSKAPHYTEMVMKELYDKYGEEKVARSGYQVTTTLDMNVQNQLQAAITANMPTIERNGGSNASAVAIDPATGEIRGLMGSKDWNDETFGKVNMVTTPRQPGSSFKPIYYSQALADGTITPATILQDKKTDFGGYAPQNADRRFRGDVTVRNALDWSLNIPAVEVMQKVGVTDAINNARKMGIMIDPDKNYGLALALGTAEAPLMQMTNAYAGFANQGLQNETVAVKGINSKFDEKVYRSSDASKRFISEQGAYLISNILSDNAARASVFGSSLNVYDAKTRAVKKVAVKTGTTDDSRDAWTIGYTPQMAVGVWVGNNDNRTMVNGGSIMAGPIFTKSMGAILAGVSTDFSVPSGVVQRQVCSDGSLAESEVKGKTRSEYFIATFLPSKTCNAKPVVEAPEQKPDEEEPDTDNPIETTMTLSASPSGTAPSGTVVTFTVTLTPSAAEGTVVFKDGQTTIGSSSVSGGTASVTTSSLTTGVRQISATFTPTASSDYETATAQTVYVIGAGVPSGNGNGNSQPGNGPRANRNQ
jgi:penicillin-binding protein 1A